MEIKKEPALTSTKLIDKLCESVVQNNKLSSKDLMERNLLVKNLENLLVKFWPQIQLSVYGSMCSGLALKTSDIDLSLSFSNNPTSLNKGKVAKNVRLVASILNKMPGIKIVNILENIRVPLIKLHESKTNLDVDISFLHKSQSVIVSETIKVYCDIDSRALVLGCMLKKLTKALDISTTVRCPHNSLLGRDLSQYAYVVMMTYYLQQTSPPVLPVLRELGYVGSPKTDWTAKICVEWSGHQRNKKSVGELWLGFLDFYTEGLFNERFDSENIVISIEQSDPLYKANIGWEYSTGIAIQDPGNYDSNIGDIPLLNYLKMKTVFVNAKIVLEKVMDESNLDVLENYFDSITALTNRDLSRPNYERSRVEIPEAMSSYVEYKPRISSPEFSNIASQQSQSLEMQSSTIKQEFVTKSNSKDGMEKRYQHQTVAKEKYQIGAGIYHKRKLDIDNSPSNWKEYKDRFINHNLHKNKYAIPQRFTKKPHFQTNNLSYLTYFGNGDKRHAFKMNNAKRNPIENYSNHDSKKKSAQSWKELKQMSDEKELCVKDQRDYVISEDLSTTCKGKLETKKRSDFDQLLKENGIYYK